MKHREEQSSAGIIHGLTIAVLFAVILLLVVFSAASYQGVTAARDGNDHRRAVLSYVTTAVHNNGKGEVFPREIEGSQGIVIKDGDTGYEQRIYMKDGKLLQEYLRSSDPSDPKHALVIGEVSEFAVDYASDDVLSISTDAGTSYVDTAR